MLTENLFLTQWSLRRTIADDPLYRSKMTSQLNNFIPVLDGTNYQQWAATMQSYLMSQGQWKCVKTGATAPALKEEDGESNQGEIDSWLENEEKALGNMSGPLTP